MEHIRFNLGNVVMIGTVSLLTVGVTLAAVNYASKRDIPVASRTARGVTDFVAMTTNQEAA